MSLEDIKARAEAASAGPWFAVRYYVGAGDDQGDPDAEIATAGYKPDAQFIAHARTDIPKLVAALEAVQAKVKELQDDISGEPQEIGNALEHIITDALGD